MAEPTSVTAKWVIPFETEGRPSVVVERSADGLSIYAGKQSAIMIPRDSIRAFVIAVESAEWYAIPGDKPPAVPKVGPKPNPSGSPKYHGPNPWDIKHELHD